jgi:hypothetical protein
MGMSNRIKVVYILGACRSGSTLLERLLGQVPGFFSLGELKGVWKFVFGEDMLCGCGTTFRQCPFWSAVFRRAFGGVEKVDPRIGELSVSLLRLRQLPQLLCPALSRSYRNDLDEFSRANKALYRAAQQESGCRILIDSSKFNRDCIVVNRMPDVDLYVVHLIRDSRAVAYSWLRKKVRPEVHLRKEFMANLGVKVSSREWLFTNAMSESLRPFLKHYFRLYYEDLVDDPRGVLSRVCAAVDEPEPVLDFIDGCSAHLAKAHTVAGNPIRFQEGLVPIRADTEWVEKLSRRHKSIVTAITWPLLQHYGYLQ